MKKDLIEFLTENEAPPALLDTSVRKDITLSFRGRSILMKFLFWQALGALFSMSVCPQFGLGLVEGHGIVHAIRHYGDWVCAAFCGGLFLTSGMLLAFLAMKGEELWWIWQRHKFGLVFVPGLLWGTLMMFNLTLELPQQELPYHVIWLVAALATQAVWMQSRSHFYEQVLSA
jgi:hypothetical protein